MMKKRDDIYPKCLFPFFNEMWITTTQWQTDSVFQTPLCSIIRGQSYRLNPYPQVNKQLWKKASNVGQRPKYYQLYALCIKPWLCLAVCSIIDLRVQLWGQRLCIHHKKNRHTVRCINKLLIIVMFVVISGFFIHTHASVWFTGFLVRFTVKKTLWADFGTI